MLDLRLRKLAHAQQSRLGRDLVAVGLADLRRGKGQAVAVVVEQVPEVDKDPLRGLRAEVADLVAARADRRLEHEVEGVGARERVARLRGFHGVFLEGVAQAVGRELLDGGQQLPRLLALVGREVGALVVEQPLERVFEEVVGAVAVARGGVRDHKVGEAVDVAAGLEDGFRGHGGALDLEHAFF